MQEYVIFGIGFGIVLFVVPHGISGASRRFGVYKGVFSSCSGRSLSSGLLGFSASLSRRSVGKNRLGGGFGSRIPPLPFLYPCPSHPEQESFGCLLVHLASGEPWLPENQPKENSELMVNLPAWSPSPWPPVGRSWSPTPRPYPSTPPSPSPSCPLNYSPFRYLLPDQRLPCCTF